MPRARGKPQAGSQKWGLDLRPQVLAESVWMRTRSIRERNWPLPRAETAPVTIARENGPNKLSVVQTFAKLYVAEPDSPGGDVRGNRLGCLSLKVALEILPSPAGNFSWLQFVTN
jgi:hypothetical protein